MKKTIWALMLAALCAMSAMPALADSTDMESTGHFRFSVAINGNYEELDQNDVVYEEAMEMFIQCPCGAEMHDITTEYQVETSAGCPYDITIKKYGSGYTRDGFKEDIAPICDSKGRPLTAGEYSFTLKVQAQCAGESGTGVLVIPLKIADGNGKPEDGYGDSVESIVKNINYFAGVNYDLGDSNYVITFVQEALTELEYYDRAITGHYGENTRIAIKNFQKDQKLPANGRTDVKTMTRLFGTYLGKMEVRYEKEFFNPEWSSSRAWFDQIGLKKGTSLRLIDLRTDIAMNVQVLNMEGHVNVEPLRVPDTRALCRIFGVNSAERIEDDLRPMLLVIEHGGESIQIVCSASIGRHDDEYENHENHYYGHFCLYLNGFSTDRMEEEIANGHQEMLKEAVDLMTEKSKSQDRIGIGDIISDEDLFGQMPPVDTPMLILPDGRKEELSSLLKYQQPQDNGNGTITYNIHMHDCDGEEQALLSKGILCFPYPEGLDENSAGKYRIIIHHEVDKNTTDIYKSENGDIEFTKQGLCIQVRSFSPFKISMSEAGVNVDLPQTGDASLPLSFLILVTMASLFGIGLLKKRKIN